MNGNPRDNIDSVSSQSSSQLLSVLLKLLTQVPGETTLVSQLSTAFEIKNFQLGDVLTVTNLADGSRDAVHTEPIDDNLYLVCQGRVRLLAWDAEEQQEVSIARLETGEIFGCDRLFNPGSGSYRAIAASSGQIAQLPSSKLQLILAESPQFQAYLQQQTQYRQRLIFFKTATGMRSLTPQQQHSIWPYLLPNLLETSIPAGTGLNTLATDENRFWLKSGEIEGEPPAKIGSTWGYPDPIPTPWIAKTDLLVYQLSSQAWETVNATVRTAPTHAPAVAHHISLPRQRNLVLVPPLPQTQPASESVRSPSPIPQTQAATITFPQPQRRFHWPRRYPFIQQQSTTDCGAACLGMISDYWGRKYRLHFLREVAGTGRSGASLNRLAKAAESLGFQARPVRASLQPLRDQPPWIAHWQGHHYVVVYRCQGDRILIADPAMGRHWIDTKTFTSHWTGYALILAPGPQLYEHRNLQSQGISTQSFLGILWPYRGIIGQILTLSLLIQLFGLITPLFTQIILDQVVVSKSLITLHAFALGLLLFSIWHLVLGATRQYLLDYFSNRVDLTLIGGFINHTLRLPLKFFESRHVGDILTRVQENQKIQLFLTRKAVTTWLDALMAVVYIGLMLYYNWRLALLVLALIPPIGLLTLASTPFLRKVSREIFNEGAKQNSSLVEILTGISTVKATASEREMRWRWEDQLTHTINAKFRGQKLSIGLQTTGSLINTLGNTALLWYGAMLVIQDQLTIGQFVAFNMMIGSVIGPVLSIVQLWGDFQEVIVSIERLDDVFAAEPEENPCQPMLVLPRLKGYVRFEKVCFRYSPDDEYHTLQNISFEVEPGQTVAIVGRSGSGKSTLVKLLQAFYYPEQGRIEVDGHDLRHVSPQSLRSQLGVVPQDCYLFSGTILENITLYKERQEQDAASLEAAIEAAKLAEAHGFIQELPLGYQTQVGERGTSLSGGQRQRIAIARALLGDPRILILDEATSSLDTESERRFQQNLARLSRERTTLIIAHRLSTVRHADRILVLDRGILAEQGTHEQLIAQQGLYYYLAQQQLDL